MVLLRVLAVAVAAASNVAAYSRYEAAFQDPAVALFADPRPPECPPCFNCNLDDFPCHQFANCTASSGRCSCPPGWGGDDCTNPLCGSLADGKDRPPRTGEQCDCPDGWEGINCNVCTKDDVCNNEVFIPGGEGGVCYNGGLVVHENYQQCDVTNKAILTQLNGKIPQVTFSCNNETATCNFQFWVDQKESFYCGLDTCNAGMDVQENVNFTTYACENIQCRCVPGRMLCGENGSIDLGEFLEESIKGPATFTTKQTAGGDPSDRSEFSEPSMDDLISSVFGDSKIFLSCKSGECIHQSELPGRTRTDKRINSALAATIIAATSLFIVALALGIWYLSRRQTNWGPIHLSDDEEDAHFIIDHKPASLAFRDVSYTLKDKQILFDVQGTVHPGEVMAIMGASGAGKTTFLDILARKNKRGLVHGEAYVNGEKVDDDDFKRVIGFVDQDDTLLPTLTVHETIVDSAMLRLPRKMSKFAKLQRVEDVERQLGIYHIRNQIIGSEEGNGRGISGGEKRRVGIACELVTSPSILFLDEPTSGLDAYNAFNVVECLVTLAKTYNRTIVMTIHQPRSNIVALFDQLLLLAQGHTVYSGPFTTCQSYFDSIGFSCPPGFNIADYLVDLTMHAGTPHQSLEDNEALFKPSFPGTRTSSVAGMKSVATASVTSGGIDSEDASVPLEATRPKTNRKISVKQQQEQKLFSRKKTLPSRVSETTATDGPGDHDAPLPHADESTGTDLDILITSYKDSDVYQSIQDDLNSAISSASAANGNSHPNVQVNGGITTQLSNFQKTSIPQQFLILSVRTWRNLYRNPMLMLTHYAIAIVLAVFLGFLYFNLQNDISGFQNRLGLFFFLLALFGFGTLTSLTVFAPERLLFVRERAKGYYAPISYFAAKVIFDIVPLRLIPPLIMGGIVYTMTGLIPEAGKFFYFVMLLELFNLAAAAICLFIGIVFKNGAVANLIGSLVMLFSLLFSGFLLNHDTIPKIALWLQYVSNPIFFTDVH
jgi:ABC-type multidrug transport system ATPase subunit